MSWLIVSEGTSFDSALSLAQANDCVGWYTGIPPVWVQLAAEQGWTLPCVVTQDAETGDVTGWTPA